ncbi:LLM class flavin-dependent oxidoreductase [Rhodopila sp.]|jgi:alkanesulfonate monooxygenase|uniref:LLM class flavin-dependent oxidoreductase n=1 Tax=Rhodopila sp. TaxID=2480087 RepID=UPI002CB1401F|nr:LLM class flavin-dependent oxidoreductase [Rhodopila sp.]HVZ08622.1 LLM class flavin-dependent oxidoreductase [Rhodopila sp.]
MTPEFIGMIHHREASEIMSPPPLVIDRAYIRDFAQAAEAGGFDKLLVGYYADGPDGFLIAADAAAQTERLGFLLAHRPGFVAPPLAARKLATLDQITGGRLSMHVISGGDDADQFRDGDVSTKDERYARTDEYLDILKRIWTDPAPTVDHAGQFYRFKGAYTAIRCVQQPRIPIYFGGASAAAIAVAAKHADVYMLWGETHAQVREITARIDAEAARQNRMIRYSLSFRPILAETEDEAWARAEQIKQTIIQRRKAAGLGAPNRTNEGSKRLLAAAAQGERLDKRLWTGAALLTGASGNTTSLVGTPRQVAEALVDYWDMGVTTFLVRGFNPLADNREYGRSLLPLTKQLIAEREAARSLAKPEAAE